MTVREKTRLEKFRQLLSSHNTDLGAFTGPGQGGTVVAVVLRGWTWLLSSFYFCQLLVSGAQYLGRSLLLGFSDQGEGGLQTVGRLPQLCLCDLQQFSELHTSTHQIYLLGQVT